MTDNRMSGDAGLEPSGLTMNEALELRTEVEYLRTKVHALDNALAEQARRQVSAEMDSSRRIDSDREKSLLLQLDAKDVEIDRLKNGIANSQSISREHIESLRRSLAHAMFLVIRNRGRLSAADSGRMKALEKLWKSGLPECRRRTP